MTTDPCIYCDRDTAPGTGLFVNRIPADRDLDDGTTREGWMCPECQMLDCEVCGDPTLEFEFTDDGRVMCYDCAMA